MREYAVVIEGDDEQGYSAYSPDVPGVAAAAGDRGEVARAMREAVTARVGDGARIVVSERAERPVRAEPPC